MFTTEVRVAAWLGRGLSERWREPVGGNYRLQAGLFDGRGALPTAPRTSEPFEIRAP